MTRLYAVCMGIKEIAKRANVSKTTVSLALNGHKGVGHQTRMKIIEIAREMNYRVPGERAVAHPSRGFILFARLSKHGIFLSEDQNIFIIHYIDGINRVVKDSGYTLEIFDHHLESIEAFTEEVANRQPKGVVILGTELSAAEVEGLSRLNVPYVVIDTYFEHIPCDFVDMANIGAVYNVVEHLVATGHKDICMVTSSVKTGNILMRERGFALALQQFGMRGDESAFLEVRPGFNGAYEDMKRRLEGEGTLPQAVFCYNDVAAFGTIKALKESGIHVPEHISIVGFDDLPMSSMLEPHLSSVKVSNMQIGSAAAEILIERLEVRRTHAPSSLLVSGTLMMRDSVIDRRE